MQEAACRALVELTPGKDTKEWRKVLKEGGSALAGLRAEYAALAAHGVIDAMVQAMATHACSASVVEAGCKVLRAMARNVDNCVKIAEADHQVKIAKAGGIEAILRAMRGHGGDAEVQAQGCGAFRNLAVKNADNKVKIGEAGGIEAILGAMRGHEGDAEVQKQGCRALCNFALNSGANKALMRDHGGLGLARKAYDMHRHVKAQELITLLR